MIKLRNVPQTNHPRISSIMKELFLDLLGAGMNDPASSRVLFKKKFVNGLACEVGSLGDGRGAGGVEAGGKDDVVGKGADML